MLPFTVFTPTYDRAHTLRRVYDSLCKQPARMFEWLVVDDGSHDETPSLLAGLTRIAPFSMRTIRQPNGGKHRAHNAALPLLTGELTVFLDSDDELTPGALEAIWREWQSIPAAVRDRYAGIIGHSSDANGKLAGKRLPSSHVDGSHFELVAGGVMVGEKLPSYRTDLLRGYPFPERHGDNSLVPEGVVWLRIGEAYTVRCIDTIVRVYHRDLTDDNTLMNRFKSPTSNAWGRMQYGIVALNLARTYWPRFAPMFAKVAAQYVRCALHVGVPVIHQAQPLEGALPRTLWAVAIPIGTAAWLTDRLRTARPSTESGVSK
ncbi:MAG: glycosyltransferase family 2 protein [Deltaproteobacteria bacterium]|nr:glycosyltransferase family 2 protein [Deltaproteobacteria bacterium]